MSAFRISGKNVIERAYGSAATSCDYGFNDCRYLQKVQLAVQERLHCNLVGGIEYGRRQPAGPCRRLRQRETTELVGIGRTEIQARGPDEIQEFYT